MSASSLWMNSARSSCQDLTLPFKRQCEHKGWSNGTAPASKAKQEMAQGITSHRPTCPIDSMTSFTAPLPRHQAAAWVNRQKRPPQCCPKGGRLGCNPRRWRDTKRKKPVAGSVCCQISEPEMITVLGFPLYRDQCPVFFPHLTAFTRSQDH